jgi:hypothetical protein
MPKHTHTSMRALTRTHKQGTHTYTNTCTHARMHTRTRKQDTHTQIPARTHGHTRTRKQGTHTQIPACTPQAASQVRPFLDQEGCAARTMPPTVVTPSCSCPVCVCMCVCACVCVCVYVCVCVCTKHTLMCVTVSGQDFHEHQSKPCLTN